MTGVIKVSAIKILPIFSSLNNATPVSMSASASLLLLSKPRIYQILNFEFFFEQYLFSHNSQFINCNTIHMLQYSTLNLTYWQIDDVSIYCQTLLDFSLWYPFYYYIDKCVCLYYIHLDGWLIDNECPRGIDTITTWLHVSQIW